MPIALWGGFQRSSHKPMLRAANSSDTSAITEFKMEFTSKTKLKQEESRSQQGLEANKKKEKINQVTFQELIFSKYHKHI